jgi:hypothetical protein
MTPDRQLPLDLPAGLERVAGRRILVFAPVIEFSLGPGDRALVGPGDTVVAGPAHAPRTPDRSAGLEQA